MASGRFLTQDAKRPREGGFRQTVRVSPRGLLSNPTAGRGWEREKRGQGTGWWKDPVPKGASGVWVPRHRRSRLGQAPGPAVPGPALLP